MIQVLWLGRGGQGAFTAARLLGTAWTLKGGWALSFPSFGPERRGAPLRAFTKLDSKPISDRSEIKAPDYTVDLGAAPKAALELAAELKLPVVNTIMLGRLARQLAIEERYLEQAVELVLPPALWEKNKDALFKAYSK